MASNPKALQPSKLRLLLDQGFPNPQGFDPAAIDATVEITSLRSFNRSLAEDSTPDWTLYCYAAEAGFDGMVTRDMSQLNQVAEMYVLSRLSRFTLITWRARVEDPIREWGQLLAYLPEVKKRLANDWSGNNTPDVILLPDPSLSAKNLQTAEEGIGRYASQHQLSVAEVRRQALVELRAWLTANGDDDSKFDQLLGIKTK